MLQFDDDTRAIIDTAYLGRDFTRRRHANLDALAPRAGERMLDLGCGQGLGLAELARAVGSEGRAIGVEPAPDMRRGAEAACAGLAQAELLEGAAEAIPLPDAALDGAVAVQVMEYVADVPAALAELRRVVRPGGRVALGDTLFSTLHWRSDDPARMTRAPAPSRPTARTRTCPRPCRIC